MPMFIVPNIVFIYDCMEEFQAPAVQYISKEHICILVQSYTLSVGKIALMA